MTRNVNDDDTDRRRFDTLPVAECVRRLTEGTIGRVAWNTVDGPQVLPVTYVVHDNGIVFRTAAYGALADLRHTRRVAFEIDEFDADARSGWSVLISGPSRAAPRPTSWSSSGPRRTPSRGRPARATCSSRSASIRSPAESSGDDGPRIMASTTWSPTMPSSSGPFQTGKSPVTGWDAHALSRSTILTSSSNAAAGCSLSECRTRRLTRNSCVCGSGSFRSHGRRASRTMFVRLAPLQLSGPRLIP
jgi:hypothetical protein